MTVLAWPEATWLPSSGWDGAHVSLVWSYVPASRPHTYLYYHLLPASPFFAPPPPLKLVVKTSYFLYYPLSPLPFPPSCAGRGARRGSTAEGTVRQRWVCTHTPPLPAHAFAPVLTRRAPRTALPLAAPRRRAAPPLYLVPGECAPPCACTRATRHAQRASLTPWTTTTCTTATAVIAAAPDGGEGTNAYVVFAAAAVRSRSRLWL